MNNCCNLNFLAKEECVQIEDMEAKNFPDFGSYASDSDGVSDDDESSDTDVGTFSPSVYTPAIDIDSYI